MTKTAPQSSEQPTATATATAPVAAEIPRSSLGHSSRTSHFVVGIGASAGGLEALRQFLEPVPPGCEPAFVIVQHMDPHHEDLLAELLQQSSALPVVVIQDRMAVMPGHVYVIPPNRDLSILHGVLHLQEPAESAGLRLPIDSFFRSLAQDQQEHSIAVVLSGMGSDGTQGARAIRDRSGAVFVQTPASAKFDSIPRSTIDAGLADVVAPAPQLASEVIAYCQRLPLRIPGTGRSQVDTEDSLLEKILVVLRTTTGHDFSLYKKNTLCRRIERRIDLHALHSLADYLRYLQENPQESELLFKELLIGVTGFFRDTEVWQQLTQEVIPALLAAYPNGGKLRAWSAGCSTGEEAYSLAIVFREVLEQLKPAAHYSLQIFATDLDSGAIDIARRGTYPARIDTEVSKARLQRFFVQEEHGYRVVPEIREMVIFATQNVVMQPPFTKLNLLLCRNLLIYLEADLQRRLLPLFHYSLNTNGVLVLGSSEGISHAAQLFAHLSVSGKTSLYRRLEHSLRPDLTAFPSAFTHTIADSAGPVAVAPSVLPTPASLQVLTDALLLQHYSPAAVLTTLAGDIVYFRGRTGKYLEPAAGKTNVNVFAMARPGLGSALVEGFAKAVREKTAVTLKNISVGTNGGTQVVDVTVHSLLEPAALYGMVLVVFANVATALAAEALDSAELHFTPDARLAALAQEVQHSREELQRSHAEMQAAQETLKSSIEELQSTNEELQSTNEELTTSKEEMQSMNEELQTVNLELQARVDELSRASDDMKNLLNSTGIATLFLDNELNVRRFTPPTASIIKLIPSDVGRPITDLASDLDYPSLAQDAQEVLRSLVFHEQRVPARNDRWFTVRIMPYRTQDNRIDGVVITFANRTATVRAEAAMGEAIAVLQGRVTDQAAQLDARAALESAVLKATAILEQRLTDQQALELNQTPREPLTDKTKVPPLMRKP